MTQQSLIGAPVVASRVEFIVPGTPVAKGRPKFARRGAHVTTYTPREDRALREPREDGRARCDAR